jgi:hypothetical protein
MSSNRSFAPTGPLLRNTCSTNWRHYPTKPFQSGIGKFEIPRREQYYRLAALKKAAQIFIIELR